MANALVKASDPTLDLISTIPANMRARYFSSCWGKVRFDSEAMASAALKKAWKSHGNRSSREQQPYACRFCHKFHNGHPPGWKVVNTIVRPEFRSKTRKANRKPKENSREYER